MKKIIRVLKNEKIQVRLKLLVIALVLGLFFLGEYFKERGGHPLWYWIVMGVVIFFGFTLVSLSVASRRKAGRETENKLAEPEECLLPRKDENSEK